MSQLVAPGPFHSFNREERHAVAVVFGLLMQPGNLDRLAERLEWAPVDLDDVEVAVEWSYLRDLWHHHSKLGDQDVLRRAILDWLEPANRIELEDCTIVEFNSHFGASPRASATTIQSPSRWSLQRFDSTIGDNDEFLRTCRFKWAFNIKPDLVLATPSGKVLCIEAKMFSPEGPYPSSTADRAVFARRGLGSVSQTSVQRYLVEELLELEGRFVYLACRHTQTAADQSIIWSELFAALEWQENAPWVTDWIRRLATNGC